MLLPVTLVCILINALVSSMPAVFLQKVISLVDQSYKSGDWSAVSGKILGYVGILVAMYVVSLIAGAFYTQMMAIITQGSLKKLRQKMFDHMQDLPIRYFDTNGHGDIMSYYTNDVDTLRQLISQSLPNILISAITLFVVFCIMVYYSVFLALVVVAGVVCMAISARAITKRSSSYFLRQQITLANAEAFMEEMMTGQKVIKVFCHEEKNVEEFTRRNEALFQSAQNANTFASMLMPVSAQLGNISYVLCAILGGILALGGVGGFTLGGLASFLTFNKSFNMPIAQISMQLNAVIMGLAGADRVFRLLDEVPETDEGNVELVNVKEGADGTLVETQERTNVWAWKRPGQDGQAPTYVRVEGDVTFDDVDFGYTDEKMVLHNIKLYATPGQKIAFVGSTGAGKTTITNLINRFYEIQEGTITYDGIDVRDISKESLRRSLGIVLQDTHLFTGTIADNIRYGKLDATDEEVRAAARLANADTFIRHLPKGYDTVLTDDGGNLSQGERQLLAIARAAVADPPVLILDEATSSIDTRTEKLIEKGMDRLMAGRTVFVIAHRLSTVRNAAAIMVLEQGEIIERGDHQDLLDQGGKYYQLYTGQAELS